MNCENKTLKNLHFICSTTWSKCCVKWKTWFLNTRFVKLKFGIKNKTKFTLILVLLTSITFVCLVSCIMAQNNPILHPCDVLIPRGGNGFADDPSGCSRYYSCNQGVFTPVSCPAGFHFHAVSQTCIPESLSECQTCPLTGVSRVIKD